MSLESSRDLSAGQLGKRKMLDELIRSLENE